MPRGKNTTNGSNHEAASATGSSIRSVVALTAALGVLPAPYAPYAARVKSKFRRSPNGPSVGEVEPCLGIHAEDVGPVLPGRHSWAGDYRGKGEVGRWIRRFVRVGTQLEPHEILVTGPPWRSAMECDRLPAVHGPAGRSGRRGRLRQPRHDLRQDRLGQAPTKR
jgi:hypothetical protein